MKQKKKTIHEIKVMPRSLIQIGDIIISSHGTLKSCQKTSEKILASENVKSYLSGYNKTKLLEGGGFYG